MKFKQANIERPSNTTGRRLVQALVSNIFAERFTL